MASTYSMIFRLDYQAPGDNLNLWGLVLESGVFQLLEDALAGRVAFTLSGTKTLTTANGATDEARKMMLDVTGGSGGTITAPSVSKVYIVRNGSTGDVILTTGAGVSATVASGDIAVVMGDGTNFRVVRNYDFGGNRITNLGSPTGPNDGASKAYVDAQAWAGAIGSFPGLPGNAGRSLVVNAAETAPQWDVGPQLKTASFVAARGGSYVVDTTSGVITGSEPVGSLPGDTITFSDGGARAAAAGWAGNRFIFDPGAHTVMGSAGVMNCRIRGASFSLSLQSGDWQFI